MGVSVKNLPVLTGDAAAADVASGKTFYNTSALTKITGTLVASAGQLAKTGQTIEYTVGDDGTYQDGSTLSPRFTDNLDGTVTDHLFSLMIVKDTTGYTDLSFDDAIAFCEGLNYAGHTDWRMANINELIAMYSYGNASFWPPLVTIGWSSYFSSTTYGIGTSAYGIGIDGQVTPLTKTSTYFYLPVRPI